MEINFISLIYMKEEPIKTTNQVDMAVDIVLFYSGIIMLIKLILL